MAWKSNDGQEFTNRMGMNRRNAQLADKPRAKAASMPQDDSGNGGGDIESDPQAMQLVDQLKQMGYSGEDVAQAMDGGDEAANPDHQDMRVSGAPGGNGGAGAILQGL